LFMQGTEGFKEGVPTPPKPPTMNLGGMVVKSSPLPQSDRFHPTQRLPPWR
jgi:hypothetical protein